MLKIILMFQAIGLMSTVFTNDPEDWDSIPGWVIPKTQKMVLDATLHYKVWSDPENKVVPSLTP